MESHGNAEHGTETHNLTPVSRPSFSGIPWRFVILWAVMFIPVIIIDSMMETGLWSLWALLGFLVWLGAKIPDMWGVNRWVIRVSLAVLLAAVMTDFIGLALVLALVAIVVLAAMWLVAMLKSQNQINHDGETLGDDLSSLIAAPPPVETEPEAVEPVPEETEEAATSEPQRIFVNGHWWTVEV